MRAWKPVFFVLCFVSSVGIVGQETASDVKPQLETPPSRVANFSAAFGNPTWHFRVWQDNSLITLRLHAQGGIGAAVFDQNGALKREIRLDIQGAEDSGLGAAAITPSGTLVVSGGSMDREGRVANFIGLVDSSNRVVPVLRVNPFVVTRMCAAEDNTIWAFGWERSSEFWGAEAKSYLALRQFDLVKGQIRAVLERSAFHMQGTQTRYPEELALRCLGTKIALFIGSAGQLFIYDTAVQRLTRYRAPILPLSTQLTGIEMTRSGEIAATITKSGVTGVFRLATNSDVAQWVPFPEGSTGTRDPVKLIGWSGDDLVFLRPLDHTAEWRRVEP